MGWKMTKEAALKRQKAEHLFEEGFGPLKVSRELEVNFISSATGKQLGKTKSKNATKATHLLTERLPPVYLVSDTATELWEKCSTFPAFGSVGIGPDNIESFQSCKQGKIRGAKNNGQEDSSTSLLS